MPARRIGTTWWSSCANAGFSRADTDHMRLLLEAATHMMTRSRLARRIVRRPYYPEARRFFELIAPTYDVEVAAFDRFLAEARDHPPRRRRRAIRGRCTRRCGRGACAAPPTAEHPNRADLVHPGAVADDAAADAAADRSTDSATIILTEAMAAPDGGSDADASVTAERVVRPLRPPRATRPPQSAHGPDVPLGHR